MKYLAVAISIAIVISVFTTPSFAYRKKYKGLPRTEAELVSRVVSCLQKQDTIGYYNLFPPFDTLWHLVMHNTDNTQESIQALNELKEHPRVLVEFDPYYNPSIMDRFCNVLQKGADSGIRWGNITLARYELQKQPITKNLIGFDKIASERFMGYIFIRDIGFRTTFCVTITEMQKIKGFFVGGQINNICEANTVEEYDSRIEFEKNYIIKMKIADYDSLLIANKKDSLRNDSIKKGLIKIAHTDTLKKNDTFKTKLTNNLNASITDEDTLKIRREVVDRKYYEGKFDDEIPVEMFVRYMKDLNTGRVMYWDALYKFGDQENYIKLDVLQVNNKWEFDDDPPVGSMELVLKNRTYTGSWTNNENQSGYDVVMKEMPISPRKLEMLDNILEKGLAGRTDEPNVENKKDGKKKKINDKNKKTNHKSTDEDN